MVADPKISALPTLPLPDLPDLSHEKAVAVGLSGGPDSMALTRTLCDQLQDLDIHALTVDHGLRAGSDAEARQVGEWVQDWPYLKHYVLSWEGEKPQSRIMEEARDARYRLMAEHCAAHNIHYLFLAHHQDDQAETFLFRLAKGSGLDGLAGMRSCQDYSLYLQLLRPFLNTPKADLVAFCEQSGIPFAQDPSNQSDDYARPRLRKSQEVLESEGLTSKRLASTAMRLSRARAALEEITIQAFERTLKEDDLEKYVFDFAALQRYPEDIQLRVLLQAIRIVSSEKSYGPRLEKVEALHRRLISGPNVKETLGGCIIALAAEKALLSVIKERVK